MGHELSPEEHAQVMARLDTSGDGRVEFDEFCAWWDVGLSLDALYDADLASEIRSTVEDGAAQVQTGAGTGGGDDDTASGKLLEQSSSRQVSCRYGSNRVARLAAAHYTLPHVRMCLHMVGARGGAGDRSRRGSSHEKPPGAQSSAAPTRLACFVQIKHIRRLAVR